MRRFVWRLQRVLEIRAKEEQIRKTELLKLTQRLTEKRSELLIQKRILNEMIAALAEMKPHKRLMEQELFLKYSTTSDDLIRQFEKQIRQLEIEQSDKIAQVLKLKRFREGMEKLREQAKMKFVKEQEKLEQKELDEMAAIRFAREMDTPVQSATGGLDRIRQGKQTSAGQGRRHLEQADATLRSSASLRSTRY